MQQSPTLQAIILTLNEERHIAACIKSLQWADEILVLDSYSTDTTLKLAQEMGALVHQHPFENYAQQRNIALNLATADWVFFVDADERATAELAEEIKETIVTCNNEVGWWVPRYNYILGHRMEGAGWRPDYQLRLLRRGFAHYDPERPVHELAILKGEEGYLKASLLHYNYDTLKQFIDKQQRYLAYDVSILLQQDIKPHIYTPYIQAIRHFWWRFIELQGWRDGGYGLLLSAMMSYYEILKYKRVRRKQRAHS